MPGIQKTPLGVELRRLRERKRLRQKSAALEAGINQSYWSNLESGNKGPPSEAVLARIATALCLSADERAKLGEAAGRSRRTLQLPPTVCAAQCELHAVLIERAAVLTADQIRALRAIAEMTAA